MEGNAGRKEERKEGGREGGKRYIQHIYIQEQRLHMNDTVVNPVRKGSER